MIGSFQGHYWARARHQANPQRRPSPLAGLSAPTCMLHAAHHHDRSQRLQIFILSIPGRRSFYGKHSHASDHHMPRLAFLVRWLSLPYLSSLAYKYPLTHRALGSHIGKQPGFLLCNHAWSRLILHPNQRHRNALHKGQETIQLWHQPKTTQGVTLQTKCALSIGPSRV